MTFSVVARCSDTGMFGIAISSSSPAVAARCAWARAGVGAVATQNITDPGLGNRGLDILAQGTDAKTTVEQLTTGTRFIEFRQLLVVDNTGQTCIYSGNEALGVVGEAQANHVAAAGNLLDNPSIPRAMVQSFEDSQGHLGDRLVQVMQAALEAGGEAGPVHSAGLLLVDKASWPVAELRCDWAPDTCPIKNIATAWAAYKPQMQDYVQRAINPTKAPSYDVPGDE